MAKRGWSLTDAQLERRKQNPAARRSTRPDAATTRAKVTARSKALSRPSDYQQRRASGQRSNPYIVGYHAATEPTLSFRTSDGRTVTSGEATYGYPDAASVSSRPSPTERTYLTPTRGAATMAPVHDPYSRRSSVQSPGDRRTRTPETKAKRQASTQAAYRAADASMFNSTVTPKAERVEDKKPRSRMSPDQNVFW